MHVLEILATRWSHGAERERLNEAAQHGRHAPSARDGGRVYCSLARILRGVMATSRPRFWGFPWFLTIFDLMVRHWVFSVFRRRVAATVLGQLPAIGLMLEAVAKRATLVRLWRFSIGRLGFLSREARIDSLREALVSHQQPNGCWSWTVVGTALSLIALHNVRKTGRRRRS